MNGKVPSSKFDMKTINSVLVLLNMVLVRGNFCQCYASKSHWTILYFRRILLSEHQKLLRFSEYVVYMP